MAKFTFCKPRDLQEALKVLADFQNDAMVLAGGTDLVPMLNHELIQLKYVVAIGQIEGLDQRFADGDDLCFGPMVTHEQVRRSSLVQEYALVLAEAAGTVGSLQTRNVGTVAGNLGNASPSADTATALLVLDAELTVVNRNGAETVPLTSFFKGPKKTCLKPDQLIQEIRFKRLGRKEGSAYCKVGRRSAVTMAVVSAAAYLRLDEDRSKIDELRLALGSVAPTPVRAYETEKRATGRSVDEVHQFIGKSVKRDIHPITDIRGTKEYRERIAPVVARRAVEQALRRAEGNVG
jgi:carbon-monoxide dehydrogenase medium subunit